MITLKDVKKHFGDVQAVNGVSFEIGKGEVVGFLGPNGAGKTTTMRLITGYLKPTEGKIKVEDADPANNRVEAVSKIGYLPENNPLYNEMKVREYLHFVQKLKQIRNPKYEIRNKSQISNTKSQTENSTSNISYHVLQEIAELCGVEDKLATKIDELSRGYKQRVGLAAAMLGEPQVLIMDEPTSGLDPNQVVEIRDLIRELGEERTVILSTHILQEVEAVCSRVIIIHEGKIVFDGPVPKKKGRMEKIFREVTIGSS